MDNTFEALQDLYDINSYITFSLFFLAVWEPSICSS